MENVLYALYALVMQSWKVIVGLVLVGVLVWVIARRDA